MRSFIRRTTTLAVLGALAIGSGLPAAAQSGQVERITQRQSIKTALSSTGEPGDSRVFTQLKATGSGPVTVSLPQQSTKGLRSLDGFGSPDVNGDEVVWSLDASEDGTARSVADNTAELPVSVSVVYRLDGAEVDPKDLAGEDGEVEVEYTVSNLTAEPRDIVSFDAENNKVVETVDIAVPMVGSLSLTLPPQFANISAPGAVTVGDGRGNTVVNFSLLLFAPLGADVQTVSWSADAVDTAIPETSLQVLPVDDKSFNSLNATADAYKGATGSLTDLANGALIINSNLLLLGSGASQLLDGLGQLSDGAGQLSDGLANTAAPGARQLADGMGKAREGGGQLATGLGELALGATRLSDGLGAARAGGGKLSAGLGDLAAGAVRLSDGLGAARAGGGKLSAGLGDLSGGATRLSSGLNSAEVGAGKLAEGLQERAAPGARALADGLADTAVPGSEQINDTLKKLLAGLGDTDDDKDDKTVIGGLNSIATGVDTLKVTQSNTDGCNIAASQVAACGIEQLTRAVGAGQVGQIDAGIQEASTLPSVFSTQLSTFGATFAGTIFVAAGQPSTDQCAQVVLGAQALQGAFGPEAQGGAVSIFSSPVNTTGEIGKVVPVCLSALKAKGSAAGLGDAAGGLATILAGLNNTGCDKKDPTNEDNPCGFKQVLELLVVGSGALVDGLKVAATGAGDLADGLDDAATGSGDLLDGLGQLADGGGQLAAGAGAAAAGSKDLVDGLGQLDDGAGQLAAGAGQASAGSKDLADGLRQLDEGGYKLAEGAGKASSGSRDLASGLVQLDDGSNKLANGLGDAADGSVKIADGLGSAEEGGGKIADGVGKLQEGFEERLIGGVSAGRQGASHDYETVRAVIQRGKEGAAPYGIAEGAESTTVFQFDLAGVGTEEGPSTPILALFALVALAVAGGLGLGLRRMIA